MVDLSGVKLVVWDLDGTLIDSYGVYAEVMAEAAQLGGLDMPTEAVIRRNFHGSLDESMKAAFDLVDGPAFATLLNDFLRIQENYYAQPEEHLFPDVLKLAERLHARGLTQIVVTNREHKGRGNASPQSIVENSSLKRYITHVISGDDAPARKPAAGVLENYEPAQQLTGENMLVIGDQFVDAQLAKNLNARAVIVNRGNEPVPHLDTLGDVTSFLTVVSSLNEVAPG